MTDRPTATTAYPRDALLAGALIAVAVAAGAELLLLVRRLRQGDAFLHLHAAAFSNSAGRLAVTIGPAVLVLAVVAAVVAFAAWPRVPRARWAVVVVRAMVTALCALSAIAVAVRPYAIGNELARQQHLTRVLCRLTGAEIVVALAGVGLVLLSRRAVGHHR